MAPASSAAFVASRMNSGVSKSGSPAPRSMIDRPAARSALARCETAIVADSWMEATLGDGTKKRDMVGPGSQLDDRGALR